MGMIRRTELHSLVRLFVERYAFHFLGYGFMSLTTKQEAGADKI